MNLLRVEEMKGGLYTFVRNDGIYLVDYLGLMTEPGLRDWQKCNSPKVWSTKLMNAGIVPPADGCSVPSIVVKIGFPEGGSADNPTGQCSFKPACDAHDYCYSNCRRTKVICDEQFRKGMKSACDNCAARMIGDGRAIETFRQTCKRWADLYELGVEQGGEGPYRNRQEQNCECVCTSCSDPVFCPHPNR